MPKRFLIYDSPTYPMRIKIYLCEACKLQDGSWHSPTHGFIVDKAFIDKKEVIDELNKIIQDKISNLNNEIDRLVNRSHSEIKKLETYETI